jgi:hypothetical protein
MRICDTVILHMYTMYKVLGSDTEPTYIPVNSSSRKWLQHNGRC